MVLCLFSTATPPSISSSHIQSPLRFLVEPRDEIFARESSTVHLNCTAIADDGGHVTITWRKDGRTISGADFSSYSSVVDIDRPTHFHIDQTGSLIIVGVARRNAAIETSSPVSRDGRRRPIDRRNKAQRGGANLVGGDQGQYECVAHHQRYGAIISTPTQLRVTCKSIILLVCRQTPMNWAVLKKPSNHRVFEHGRPQKIFLWLPEGL